VYQPSPTGDLLYPFGQLCFGQYRPTAKRDVTLDGGRGEFVTETAEFSEPLIVRAENEVISASMSGTSGHSTQPGSLVLLGNALWHRSKVLWVHPSFIILLYCWVISVVKSEIVRSAVVVGRIFDG
jgi:hypothetical protein